MKRKRLILAVACLLTAAAAWYLLVRYTDLPDMIRYGANTVILSARNNRFDKTGIRLFVEPSETVYVILKNRDEGRRHNLVVPGLHLETTVLSEGEKAVLEFTAKRYGSFDFLCTFHPKTMKGVIRLEKRAEK